jgi:MFS family permease
MQDQSQMTAHQRRTLTVCCTGFFMVLLDLTIVNTALPTIETRLHAGFTGVQWVVDAYTLSFAALLLTGGTFADRFGRKRLFGLGMALFAASSLLCGLSTSTLELNLGRALQGIGGAALAPSSLALVATAFPARGSASGPSASTPPCRAPLWGSAPPSAARSSPDRAGGGCSSSTF